LIGRPINTFEDYRQEKCTNLEKKSSEIRRLFEETQDEVIQRIKSKQEIRVKNQNKRMNVKSESLPIGSQVTIESLKIHSKILKLSKIVGIFTVIGHTKLRHYWLENQNKKKLAMAYPRSRLKEVHITEATNSG